MPFLPIYFYGTPGLESDVFVSYMRCAGYTVQAISGDITEFLIGPEISGAVLVIALKDSTEPAGGIIQRLDRRQRGCIKKIFVLPNGKPFRSTDPIVQVVDCPSRLTRVVKEIQALGRITEAVTVLP